jgi:hypothetical protein
LLQPYQPASVDGRNELEDWNDEIMEGAYQRGRRHQLP